MLDPALVREERRARRQQHTVVSTLGIGEAYPLPGLQRSAPNTRPRRVRVGGGWIERRLVLRSELG